MDDANVPVSCFYRSPMRITKTLQLVSVVPSISWIFGQVRSIVHCNTEVASLTEKSLLLNRQIFQRSWVRFLVLNLVLEC